MRSTRGVGDERSVDCGERTMGTMSAVEGYREARDRGTAWLLDHVNADGSIGPIDQDFTYYRLPWTFTITGHTDAALRLCQWVHEHQFANDGDFVGVTPRQIEANAYQNATFIYGAQMLRQYDLSYRGWRHLLARQDRHSGGFRHLASGSGIAADENIPTVAMVGKAALMMGDLDAAKAAGGWFRMLWDLQPDLPDRLYYVYNAASQRLVTDFPPERAFHYVVENQQPRQRFTCGGIAAAFLTRLFQVTADPAHLALACAYMDHSMAATERQFEVTQVCKSGWGAALLYQITREAKYRDWTCRVADYFVAEQQPDGCWMDSGPYGHAEHVNIMVTAEFVMILDTMIGCLSIA
jgi:hypothetical protein